MFAKTYVVIIFFFRKSSLFNWSTWENLLDSDCSRNLIGREWFSSYGHLGFAEMRKEKYFICSCDSLPWFMHKRDNLLYLISFPKRSKKIWAKAVTNINMLIKHSDCSTFQVQSHRLKNNTGVQMFTYFQPQAFQLTRNTETFNNTTESCVNCWSELINLP